MLYVANNSYKSSSLQDSHILDWVSFDIDIHSAQCAKALFVPSNLHVLFRELLQAALFAAMHICIMLQHT